MSKLKIVITSGGTREYIDDVRVITNISTGKLGAIIADRFMEDRHQVTYVCAKNAVQPTLPFYNRIYVSDTHSVLEAMQMVVPHADVVIHSMAISDFTFDRRKPVKISSSDNEGFIEYMRQTITPTPKVIASFRALNPKAVLFGFKFTVGKSFEERMDISRNLMEKNGLDFVVANDKVEMGKEGQHIAVIVSGCREWPGTGGAQFTGKEAIADGILKRASEVIEKRNGN